jgi:hypothetical protein
MDRLREDALKEQPQFFPTLGDFAVFGPNEDRVGRKLGENVQILP